MLSYSNSGLYTEDLHIRRKIHRRDIIKIFQTKNIRPEKIKTHKMDSIDIQQIHNNNFTNTQYGKLQRIFILSLIVPSGQDGTFPSRNGPKLGSIYFQEIYFHFSWWKSNRYWCTIIRTIQSVRTNWQLGRHQQLEPKSEPGPHYRRTVTGGRFPSNHVAIPKLPSKIPFSSVQIIVIF